MKSYTPYENVAAGRDYPAILAVTSLNDTRVLYPSRPSGSPGSGRWPAAARSC